jgi:hypothetical protein
MVGIILSSLKVGMIIDMSEVFRGVDVMECYQLPPAEALFFDSGNGCSEDPVATPGHVGKEWLDFSIGQVAATTEKVIPSVMGWSHYQLVAIKGDKGLIQ